MNEREHGHDENRFAARLMELPPSERGREAVIQQMVRLLWDDADGTIAEADAS